MGINYMARFRYSLPIFFTYLINESWSNVGILVEAGVDDTKQNDRSRKSTECELISNISEGGHRDMLDACSGARTSLIVPQAFRSFSRSQRNDQN